MKVKLNGKDSEIEEKTITDLVDSRGINANSIIIELDGKIIPKAHWSKTIIKNGSVIEVISIVGGG